MIESNNEVSKDLKKALQALEQAKQRVANEKKKQKNIYAEDFLWYTPKYKGNFIVLSIVAAPLSFRAVHAPLW